MNLDFTDLGEKYSLVVKNGVLNYSHKQVAAPDVSLVLNKTSLDKIQLGEAKTDDLIQSGEIKLTGSKAAFDEFVALLDVYPFWFHIVTP